LESAGQVIQVDAGLCHPASTPILGQSGRRLGITFFGDIETDLLRPIHVRVERRIIRLTVVQTAFDTLTIVCSTANATRLARVPFRHVYDVDALDFRFVFEYIAEAVERPSVQVEVPVPTPVFRLTVLVLSNTSEFPDIDLTNAPLDTLPYDVFGEAVEDVGFRLENL
jgi:hypothetical protein